MCLSQFFSRFFATVLCCAHFSNFNLKMKLKKGTEIELEIQRLVYGGRGIGEVDGWKIFVADTVPGDRVRARLIKSKTNYGEARLLEVLEPSKLRVAARCKHFETCGGCKWQFLPYEEQLRAKEEQVKDAVVRLGGIPADMAAEICRPILPCAEPWFYRNKMELSFGEVNDKYEIASHSKSDSMLRCAPHVMLGFYPPGYHYEVFDLEECFLMSPWMAEIVGRVRDFANEHGLPHYNNRTNTGLLRNLIIREGKNTDEVMVNLVTSSELFDFAGEFAALFDGMKLGEVGSDSHREVTSVYWTTVHQVPGQKTWREEKLLCGKEFLTEKLALGDGHELSFDIRPQAFFQTNTLQAQTLYSKALELAGLTGKEVVYDLYCGTGTIGLFCAHKAKHVYGIEVNESAVENARSNAVRNGISNASFFLGTVEDQLGNLKEKETLRVEMASTLRSATCVVIVDPPRSGLGEKVVHDTAAFGAQRIVYVSCNPTTMARDIAWFAELGYGVREIWPVDMFPQTHHVECISLLEK